MPAAAPLPSSVGKDEQNLGPGSPVVPAWLLQPVWPGGCSHGYGRVREPLMGHAACLLLRKVDDGERATGGLPAQVLMTVDEMIIGRS